jgi:uncharacterized protein
MSNSFLDAVRQGKNQLWMYYLTISTKDRGLELSLGVHTANNIFSFLLVNTPDSVAPTPSLWLYIKTIDPAAEFFALSIQAGIFYAILFGGITRQSLPSSKQ